MTLIGFATYGDHAEFITDTFDYTLNGSSFGQCTKSLTVPHLDAAVLSRGDSQFGVDAMGATFQMSAHAATFDDLVDWAPEILGNLWTARLEEAAGRTIEEGTTAVFLLGRSTSEGEFAAYVFAAAQGFKATRVKTAWLMPSPWVFRPSALEFRNAMTTGVERLSAETLQAIKSQWPAQPAMQKPSSVEEWRERALQARERSLDGHALAIPIGGRVVHTRLARGQVTTRVIHEFDDSGEEFNKLVAGTQHPVGQMMACWCESGERFRDCHLAEWYADGHTCDCGSGRAFAACCRVGDGAGAASPGIGLRLQRVV